MLTFADSRLPVSEFVLLRRELPSSFWESYLWSSFVACRS